MSELRFTENADFNHSFVFKKGLRMLVVDEILVTQKKLFMRLKKKQKLGQGLTEVTRGEMGVSRIGYAFRTYPSVKRETPTTFALVV